MARPSKPPSQIIAIPVDKVAKVEAILGRKLAMNQTPIIKIRVPTADVERIRKAIK